MGMAMGIVVASGAIGGAIFPPTIGVLADHTGMRLAIWVSFVILALNLGIMMTLRKRAIGRIAGTARER
jgi:nitrate/nitrite transporter NarK